MSHDRVEAVERALNLLECFNPRETSLSLAQLSEKTGMYKSTIIRLSRSLERFGYLQKTDNRTYTLGPTLWRLGSIYRQDHDFGEYVRRVLVRLRDASGETASFYVREGNERTCLYRENSLRAARHHLDEGIKLPLDQGAAGKLLSTYAGLKADEESLEIREKGVAVSYGERDPDIAAVCVPLLQDNKDIKGALCISGLINRFDESLRDRCIELLQQEAQDLASYL